MAVATEVAEDRGSGAMSLVTTARLIVRSIKNQARIQAITVNGRSRKKHTTVSSPCKKQYPKQIYDPQKTHSIPPPVTQKPDAITTNAYSSSTDIVVVAAQAASSTQRHNVELPRWTLSGIRFAIARTA